MDNPTSSKLASLNLGNFLSEFQLNEGPYGPTYDVTGINAPNLSSGKVVSHYTKNVSVYDPLGSIHILI